MKKVLAVLAAILATVIMWSAFVELLLPHMPWWQEEREEAVAWMQQNGFSHNAYVRDGYPGWHETKLPGLDGFRIPEDWQLTAATEAVEKSKAALPQAARISVTVTDASGVQVARGFLFPTEKGTADFKGDLSAIVGFSVESFGRREKLDIAFDDREALYFSCEASGGGQRTELLCLKLADGDASLYLWFPNCEGEAYSALLHRVEAIAASFHGAGVAQE